jgi:hypothetical protein
VGTSRGKFRRLASRIDALKERLNSNHRIQICVFAGETTKEAAAWYFARRPDHAGTKHIEYVHKDCSRVGAEELLAMVQSWELEQILHEMDGGTANLAVLVE